MVFRQFIIEFSIFLLTGFSAEIPIATEYYAYYKALTATIIGTKKR